MEFSTVGWEARGTRVLEWITEHIGYGILLTLRV